MQSAIRHFPQWGSVLWLTDGNTEIGIALDFGIRVVHLSCVGMDNLYYVQPADLSDGFTKDNGWRLYGGHRIWMAPESQDGYCPDNAPVQYSLEENGVLIRQAPDPLLHIGKRLRITFAPDGSVALEHMIENLSDSPISGASWGINTLAGGGTADICFGCGQSGGCNPQRVVSVWLSTNLHDARLHFDTDKLTATFLPLPEYLKIGLYANPGKAVFQNKGQRMTITFDAQPLGQYPDNGCNFELYMGKHFMELETLGVKTQTLPGQIMRHTELWRLEKL